MTVAGELFLTFAKIGSFTFGGGYAMVPLIEREIIDRRKWIRKEEFLELLTLAQTAPGPIALNTSVFVGYKVDGYRGALCSTLGIVLPSFVVILLIAICFSAMRDNPTVEAVFKGIRPAVVALIVAPVINLSRGLGWRQVLLAAVSVLALWYFGFSPIYLIIVGAVVGIAYGFYRRRTK